jgi:hypothetical protein
MGISRIVVAKIDVGLKRNEEEGKLSFALLPVAEALLRNQQPRRTRPQVVVYETAAEQCSGRNILRTE